jgi:hypothetical protein
VERVQDISSEDAELEGIDCVDAMTPYGEVEQLYHVENEFNSAEPTSTFHKLWDSIYAERGFGWDANPWVWVVEFERVT